MQTLEYKDENGNIQSVKIDISTGINIVDIPENDEWQLTAQDSSETYQTDFVGARPKR